MKYSIFTQILFYKTKIVNLYMSVWNNLKKTLN